jgi:hypothetical protein
VIQGASTRADHEHSRSTLTVRLPVPPAAGIVEVLLVIDTPHLEVGAVTLISEELPQPDAKSSSATRPAVTATRVRGATSRNLRT